ncbi:hypothetical protein NKJ72_30230 [Mesorhizobium sp. M0045]
MMALAVASKAPLESRIGSFTPKIFQRPRISVLQVDAVALHGLAAGQQRPCVVALDALHVKPAVPARTEQLGNLAGIVLVRLVAHRRKRRTHLSRLHADDNIACLLETIRQMLRQCAGLEADLVDCFTERMKTSNHIGNFGSHRSLEPSSRF